MKKLIAVMTFWAMRFALGGCCLGVGLVFVGSFLWAESTGWDVQQRGLPEWVKPAYSRGAIIGSLFGGLFGIIAGCFAFNDDDEDLIQSRRRLRRWLEDAKSLSVEERLSQLERLMPQLEYLLEKESRHWIGSETAPSLSLRLASYLTVVSAVIAALMWTEGPALIFPSGKVQFLWGNLFSWRVVIFALASAGIGSILPLLLVFLPANTDLSDGSRSNQRLSLANHDEYLVLPFLVAGGLLRLAAFLFVGFFAGALLGNLFGNGIAGGLLGMLYAFIQSFRVRL